MPPPPLPPTRYANGNGRNGHPPPLNLPPPLPNNATLTSSATLPRNAPPDVPLPVTPRTPPALPASGPPSVAPGGRSGWRHLVAAFLGAFAAVFILVLVVVGIHYGLRALHSKSTGDGGKLPTEADFGAAPSATTPPHTGKPLADSTTWQLGDEPAKPLVAADHADIGWWARLFYLPRTSVVTTYLKAQGLTVTHLAPLHYQDDAATETITYQVDATVPEQLVRVQKAMWAPTNPDLAQFVPVLMLNEGLPAGQFWNTRRATVAADTGSKLDFAWRLKWDKASGTVAADRLPFTDPVFTVTQASTYQNESIRILGELQARVQQIDDQVQREVATRLAQVPADPSRPGQLSSAWGGDGSGEPTKSAERIGGGTLAGAAGGAAFGAAAGDAGMGAGIGAGVGLLGGIIYDSMSKRSDRERYEHRVASVNSSRRAEWRAQVRALERQRDQIRQDGALEKQRALADLAARIQAAGGRLDQVPATVPMPFSSTAPTTTASTSEQPSGVLQRH